MPALSSIERLASPMSMFYMQNRLQIIDKFGGRFSCSEIFFGIQVQF